eukprot:COSAG02_NODE_1852_length_10661_cov_3.072429_8_plen_97_part_00
MVSLVFREHSINPRHSITTTTILRRQVGGNPLNGRSCMLLVFSITTFLHRCDFYCSIAHRCEHDTTLRCLVLPLTASSFIIELIQLSLQRIDYELT